MSEDALRFSSALYNESHTINTIVDCAGYVQGLNFASKPCQTCSRPLKGPMKLNDNYNQRSSWIVVYLPEKLPLRFSL